MIGSHSILTKNLQMSHMSRFFEDQIESGHVTFEDKHGEEIAYVHPVNHKDRRKRTPAAAVTAPPPALREDESGEQHRD